ncbi:MAG: hypothetical protein ABIH20_01265 [Candidatus Diapherotrites archaeon]
MNSKGFTLFTALIAFVLIMLSLLLVQSMISTERTVSDIISDISGQEEMQAVADLARADALQVFNYGIRYSIEDFSTRDREPSDGLPDDVYTKFINIPIDWDELQAEFVADRFGVGADGKNNFALRAARHLNSILQKTPDARGFLIDLEQTNQEALEVTLQTNLNKQIQGGHLENFFEVIDCENGNFGNCTGTFYLTMDLSPDIMTDEEYEKFPLVKVENSQTGKVLKEAILPRGRFRVYVPLRLFKALAAAKEVGNRIRNNPRLEDGKIKIKEKGDAESLLEGEVRQIIRDAGLDSDPDFEFVELRVRAIPLSGADPSIIPEIDNYEVKIYFKEKDPKYMVSGDGESGDPNNHIYGVSLKKFLN